MANVDISPYSVKIAHVQVVTVAPVAVATTDVCRLPNSRGLVARVTNGATTTNITIKGAKGALDLKFVMNNGKTSYIRIADTFEYVQSDGFIHLTADQAISVQATSR